MILTIKYLGRIVEVTGKDQESIELTEPMCASELKALLVERYPNLKKETYKIAVNQELVVADFEIRETCEVAILPPFAGG